MNQIDKIEIHYKKDDNFQDFINKINGKTVAVLFDINTKIYAEEIISRMKGASAKIIEIYYPDKELLPTEDKYETALTSAQPADYLLAVGSGTLNDICKSVSFKLGVPCGVFATAASMDGYCSKDAALMRAAV